MKQPIGIFDSGVGGTSIWKEIQSLLPQEDTIYLADSKNAPYGNKSKEEILRLSIKNTEKLLQFNCKIIVVACNTATTNAITYLRAHYKIPFIGIEPAIKPAALTTKTGVIGVLATKGTLSSKLFATTSSLYSNGIKVIEQVGEGLVELIEAGKIHSKEMENLLEQYLFPMVEQNIDYLVLGCTHYPYLITKIQKIVPDYITIIDSGGAVAKQTRNLLEKNKELYKGRNVATYNFYTNANTEILTSLLPKNILVNVAFLDF